MAVDELENLRRSVALSAEELAKAAGYSRTTVRGWLAGERAIRPEAARRLRSAVDDYRRRLLDE